MATKSKVKQKCIFIVGMHRSGTSALTGVLKLMGVELGRELMRPWADNPKGFFENNKIWRYDQKILENFGSSWDDSFLYGGDWTLKHDLKPFKPYIDELLKEEFSDAPLFAIKDPRMCILFPLWQELCVQKKIIPLCLLPFRHPMEVAQSLRKRNGFSIEKGILLWINFVLTSESVTRGCPRIFLKFDDLFSNSQGLLDSISTNFDFNFPQSYENAQPDIMSFLDRGLKHHSETILGRNRMEVMAEELYLLFCSAAESGVEKEFWKIEVEKLREVYEGLFSFFLNRDLQEKYVCRQELLEAERRIESLEKDKQNHRIKCGELEEELLSCTTEKQLLENEIKAMGNTITWRLAEKLRRIRGLKKQGEE